MLRIFLNAQSIEAGRCRKCPAYMFILHVLNLNPQSEARMADLFKKCWVAQNVKQPGNVKQPEAT